MIDPVMLADKGARLCGKLAVATLPRLAETCRSHAGEVDVDLEFTRGDGGDVRLMVGSLHARVRLTCQRCLEDMDYELSARPRVVLLRPGEPDEAMPPEVDCLTVDKPIALSALVEDELLLVMPMIPLHDLEHCPARGHMAPVRAHDVAGERKPSPFAALGQLKRNEH
jgi:uncharacterized protein